MNIKPAFLMMLVMGFLAGSAVAQKKISEVTVVYDAVVNSGVDQPQMADMFDGSTTTMYISGVMSRTEMVAALASTTTIYDGKTGSAVMLKEVGDQKLLIKMTPENWRDQTKRYDSIQFVDTDETKVIAGYKCRKAEARTKDGVKFTVYYTREIVLQNAEHTLQFKNLEGLPMEYELVQGKLRIRYVVSKISMNPVPASKFDIPKTGYREMTYEESRKLGTK